MISNRSWCDDSISVSLVEQKRLTLLSHRFSVGREEEFEDTKGIIEEDNTMAKRTKDKRTNNDLQTIHVKLKIE